MLIRSMVFLLLLGVNFHFSIANAQNLPEMNIKGTPLWVLMPKDMDIKTEISSSHPTLFFRPKVLPPRGPHGGRKVYVNYSVTQWLKNTNKTLEDIKSEWLAKKYITLFGDINDIDINGVDAIDFSYIGTMIYDSLDGTAASNSFVGYKMYLLYDRSMYTCNIQNFSGITKQEVIKWKKLCYSIFFKDGMNK